LGPLGEFRSQYIVPSKGKREKRRKRKEKALSEEPEQDPLEKLAPHAEIPERPGMQNHLTIGFNSTTKYLEALAQRPSLEQTPTNVEESSKDISDPLNRKPLIAVFVPGSDQPSILYSHLPLLIKIASLAAASSPPPRLVSLPKGSEERLSAALSIPRVGLIGLIEGAPNADSFIGFIRQQVPEVEVPWLHEAVAGAYLPVNIKAIQTSAPAFQKKRKLSQASRHMEDD